MDNQEGIDQSQHSPTPANGPIISPMNRLDLGTPAGPGLSAEEEAVAKAVALSIDDQIKAIQEDSTLSNLFKPKPPAMDANTALILRLNNAFPFIDDADGDTAIYFGAPPQESRQTDQEYNDIRSHFDRVHVINSKTLRLMGDQSRFTDNGLLNPTKSFRAERILRKMHPDVLAQAEARHRVKKFTYYIDLRPPKEEDDALILTTELSCTKGVLSWFTLEDKYDLPLQRVFGHDEFSPGPLQQDTAQANQPLANTQTSNRDLPVRPTPKLPPEYSLLRHHSGLERLLHAIHGNDPKLDSAPKLWTFFALANYFNCASHERISGWITTWLYAGYNVNFIQNNPEVAYRIAMKIKSPELITDAFSILVGERALVEVYSLADPTILTPLRENVHKRKLELLDDDERNRIDHAASSFVKRINEMFSSICQNFDFLDQCKSYQTLNRIEGKTPGDITTLETARTTIKEYVRSRIYYVLCQDQKAQGEPNQDHTSPESIHSTSRESFCEVYKKLSPSMRLFTKTFWMALQSTKFEFGVSSLEGQATTGLPYNTESMRKLQGLYKASSSKDITGISRYNFDSAIIKANNIQYRQNRQSIWDYRGPSATQHFPMSHQATLDPATLPVNSLSIASPTKSQGIRSMSEPESPSPKRRKTDEFDDSPNASNFAVVPEKPYGNPLTFRPSWGANARLIASKPLAPSNIVQNQSTLALRPKTTEASASTSETKLAPFSHRGTDNMPGVWTISTSYAKDSEGRPAFVSVYDNPDTAERETWLHEGEVVWNAAAPNSSDSTTDGLVQQSFSDPSPTMDTPSFDYGPSPDEYRSYPIDPQVMLHEIGDILFKKCSDILFPTHLFHHTGCLPTNIHDTLMCLNENEFRYLPLWAPDGNDDDSGGVFDETPVPNLDPTSADIESFGPGRIRRAHDYAFSDTYAGDDLEEISSSQAISTVGKASKLATDGTRTVQSLASTASSLNGDGDGDTVVVENDNPRYDALSVVGFGEEAGHGNDSDDGDEAGFDFDDDEDSDDQDTINGDDPHDRLAEEPRDTDSENEHEPEEDQGPDQDKGKSKAQNYPHEAPDFDFDLDVFFSNNDADVRDLPYRERPRAGAGASDSVLGPSRSSLKAKATDEDEEEYDFI